MHDKGRSKEQELRWKLEGNHRNELIANSGVGLKRLAKKMERGSIGGLEEARQKAMKMGKFDVSFREFADLLQLQ